MPVFNAGLFLSGGCDQNALRVIAETLSDVARLERAQHSRCRSFSWVGVITARYETDAIQVEG